MEYSYSTDIAEIKATESERPIALVVTITELREEVSEYVYPGIKRVTCEEDEQERVVFEQRIAIDDGTAYGRMKSSTINAERMFPPRGANLVDAPDPYRRGEQQ